MIETRIFQHGAPMIFKENQGVDTKPRPVFRMVEAGERMAGSIPVWDHKSSEQEKIADRLALATRTQAGIGADQSGQAALAYRASPGHASPAPEPFGFGDLIDMINPLHHIPVIGNLYRHVSGDDIRGSSRIVGGALFGGPLGAFGSFANVIVEQETGRDILDNVVANTLPVFTDDEDDTQAQMVASNTHHNTRGDIRDNTHDYTGPHALGFAAPARHHGTSYYITAPLEGAQTHQPPPSHAAAHYQKTHDTRAHASAYGSQDATLELYGTGGIY